MDWTATLIVTAVAAAIAAFSAWRGARPPDLRRGPRLAPWRFLMLISFFVVLLMAAHMLNLAGANTAH